jgi:integrase
MASIERRTRQGKDVWRAHYRAPDGTQRNKSFTRKIEAERFLISVEHAKLTGEYIDAALSRLTVDEWSTNWLTAQCHLKPSTRERYAGIVRTHIEPAWGHVRLADVTHARVQSWLSDLAERRSPATVHKVHRVLSLILDLAVKDGRIARNAALGVKLPRTVTYEHVYLTHGQVDQLASLVSQPYGPHTRAPHNHREAAQAYRLVVLFLAYTGVRWGEMAALRVRRVNFLRRRASIVESVTIVRGEFVWGTPKGHDGRDVPIPGFLINEIRDHVAGKGPDDLVFTGLNGGPLRAKVFQDAALTAAACQLGIPGLTPHKLRHTAASLAIAAGANVKVVQQVLGHKSATMTLDLYGHLFGDQLDDVAIAMEAARTAATDSAVAHLLPRAEMT